jgi:hypothetical protein
MANLRDVARSHIEKNGDPIKAAPGFVAALLKDRSLLADLALDYLKTVAPPKKKKPPKPVSRHRPGRHRRPGTPGMPSEINREAARTADRHLAAVVFERKMRGGKKLGDLRWNELHAYKREAIATGVEMLNRGFDDVVEGIACDMIERHCVPADPFETVRNIIKAEDAMTIMEQARVEAFHRITEAKKHNEQLFLTGTAAA